MTDTLISTPTARSRVKAASIGGEQESGFEQSFSSLSYAYLKDKAPRLLDFIVGFQLVDRNEDNTKAVGIFGFQLGQQWLYAPVFFLNGDLKGHELLYIKNQDTFVPMKENWINYLLNRKPHVLGERSPQDTYQMGGLAPGIEDLAWPPEQSKFGSDRVAPALSKWARGFLPLAAACATKRASFIVPGRGNQRMNMTNVVRDPIKFAMLAADAPKLAEFLAHNVNLMRGAYEVAQRYPGIKTAFDKFHPGLFQKLALGFKEKLAAAASNIMPVTARKPKTAVKAGEFLLPQAVKKSADEKVSITVKEDVAVTDNMPELTGEEKTELLNNGYLVKDERAGDEKSVAYNVQVPQLLASPDETGLYDVLEQPASFKQMLVIQNPLSNCGHTNFLTVIRLGDGEKSKAWVNSHRTNIYANQYEAKTRTDFEKWWDEQSDGSLEVGGHYVVLCKNGTGSVPFEVVESFGDDQYKVNFKKDVRYEYDRDFGNPRNDYYRDQPNGPYISPWGAKLYIDPMGRSGTDLRAVGGELWVPNDAKFFKLKDPPKPKKKDGDSLIGDTCAPCCVGEDSGSEVQPLRPGRLQDIQVLFTEKTARMKLYSDGSEMCISTGLGVSRHQGNGALFSLIKNHGLDAKQAGDMLKTAQRKGSVIFRIKYAQPYPMAGAEFAGPGPTAPAFPGPEMGSESIGYNQQTAIYPQEEFMPVDGMQSSMTDPSVYDPFMMPDQQSMQTAQQAGQQGQKEVFDTAMIGGMLKAVRQDSLVDRYLGDLMKALDKLGRILFMFYWHNEEFEDRYGKQDLPELEDSIRNAFEVLGDVVLFLKEKTIEPGFDDMASEPNIDQSARN